MADTEPWTIQRLMEWTRQFLQRKAVDEPRLATELLLAHAMGLRKIDLYTRYHELVPDEPLAKFRELVKRAAEQEPIAYLVGYREFFSLRFKVTPDVLIPRPETETLVAEVIHQARQRGNPLPLDGGGSGGGVPASLRILDVATGSGCIAIALAKHLPGATVIATDLSEAALAVARENAEANKVAVDFRAGSLFEPVAGEPPFDYICSNPPYISEPEFPALPANVRGFEPKIALVGGADGLAVIRPLVAGVPERLADGGMLFMEIAFNQAGRVVPIVQATPGLADVRTIKDALGHERVVAARKTLASGQ
ncbi:MAG: peptide chain release factor N(5)-glutamine methyltransferase [Phycisphaerae bacterium]|nr:peptide chain release factor N(5)-glutamine methyltransferase [Phycisphaerae bacterium]